MEFKAERKNAWKKERQKRTKKKCNQLKMKNRPTERKKERSIWIDVGTIVFLIM